MLATNVVVLCFDFTFHLAWCGGLLLLRYQFLMAFEFCVLFYFSLLRQRTDCYIFFSSSRVAPHSNYKIKHSLMTVMRLDNFRFVVKRRDNELF